MDTLKLYRDKILNTLEQKIKELYACYYSKNIFKRLNRSFYKKMIDMYEEVYYEKLIKYGEIVEDEFKFNQKIKKSINNK